jgi:hypothetical protein
LGALLHWADAHDRPDRLGWADSSRGLAGTGAIARNLFRLCVRAGDARRPYPARVVVVAVELATLPVRILALGNRHAFTGRVAGLARTRAGGLATDFVDTGHAGHAVVIVRARFLALRGTLGVGVAATAAEHAVASRVVTAFDLAAAEIVAAHDIGTVARAGVGVAA